jgi:hypothetical protein
VPEGEIGDTRGCEKKSRDINVAGRYRRKGQKVGNPSATLKCKTTLLGIHPIAAAVERRERTAYSYECSSDKRQSPAARYVAGPLFRPLNAYWVTSTTEEN